MAGPDDATNAHRQAVAALLRWQLAAGVDETIGDAPVSRFRDSGPASASAGAAMPQQAAETVASAAPQALPRTLVAPPPALASAHHIAAACDLAAALAAFDGCPLHTPATRLVFGDGNPRAHVVLIGEAPGAEEDRLGKPFVGPSGQLLDRMLASIGLARGAVFISNTVFWRPPGNRPPTPAETAACQPFVERLIEIIAPRLLIALGGPAATIILGQPDSIGRLRGRWFQWKSARSLQPIDATALYHPAYLLRSPGQKRIAWRDLIAIKRRMATTGSL
ncbi:MAG: uracil-DNA glycosylase [Rhodospirillales bacterium]|nr:uracil-DNA glycosylase [Rhodospirillales bacterium]